MYPVERIKYLSSKFIRLIITLRKFYISMLSTIATSTRLDILITIYHIGILEMKYVLVLWNNLILIDTFS